MDWPNTKTFYYIVTYIYYARPAFHSGRFQRRQASASLMCRIYGRPPQSIYRMGITTEKIYLGPCSHISDWEITRTLITGVLLDAIEGDDGAWQGRGRRKEKRGKTTHMNILNSFIQEIINELNACVGRVIPSRV